MADLCCCASQEEGQAAGTPATAPATVVSSSTGDSVEDKCHTSGKPPERVLTSPDYRRCKKSLWN